VLPTVSRGSALVSNASLALKSGSIIFNCKNYFPVTLKGLAMTQNAELWNSYYSDGYIFLFMPLRFLGKI
jgi:hypothetical protein